MESIRLFIRLARPLFLLGGILLYALGGGIARFLGHPIDWNVYILGQAWVSTLQLGTQFLNEYFNAPTDQDNPNRTPFSGGSGAIGPGKLTRRTALNAALICLGGVASITVAMIGLHILSPVAIAIMVLAFLGAFFYSTPPVSLESTGYGELTTSVLVAYLVPAYAYSLQTGELHRLVAMSAFPLVFFHIAMLIAFELPDYASDLKYGKRTLLVRVGWQAGMNLHNLMIIAGYAVLALALLFELPLAVALPAFFTLPLGVLQVWQMRRIAAGAKPNWTGLTLGGLALFAAVAYLIAFTFWTR